jgi:hypothetical protein
MAKDHGDELESPGSPPAEGRAVASDVAQEAAQSVQPAGPGSSEPVIVLYESSERDSKTRLQIVQSGFGGTSAWMAIIDAWCDTSATFAWLPARILAALCSAVRVPALAPALRPAAVRA